MKKPWAFIRVPYMNPSTESFFSGGVIGPGFLNQVPTLVLVVQASELMDVRACSEGSVTGLDT